VSLLPLLVLPTPLRKKGLKLLPEIGLGAKRNQLALDFDSAVLHPVHPVQHFNHSRGIAVEINKFPATRNNGPVNYSLEIVLPDPFRS